MNPRNQKTLKADLAVLTRLELYFSLRLITRTMRRFAELLEHDYDTLMIFFVVVESCFQAIIGFGGADSDLETIERAYAESISLGTSVLNIGEATGIPRETVRRKVKTLMDMGLVATAEKSKAIYVPLSALLEPAMLEVLRAYVADTQQFVRTVQFYAKGEG
jgi:DNA-binding transcriptional ArsR family regulator